VSLNKKVLLMLGAGLAFGMLIQRLGMESLLGLVRDIGVIGTVWTNAMVMTVVPLVIAATVATLAAAPSARDVGRVAAPTLAGYALLLLAAATLTVLLASVFLPLIRVAGWGGPSTMEAATGLGTASAEPYSIAQWFTSLVPSNAVDSAVDGRLFQVIVFSLALGAAATQVSAESRGTLVRMFDGVSRALLKVADMIYSVAPLAVFILALGLGVRLGVGAAGPAAVFIVLVGMTCLVLGILLYPVAAGFGGVSLSLFARACLGAQVTAALTRSARTALPLMVSSAERELGIQPSVARTVLPIGESIFSAFAVVSQTAGVLVLAHLYQVELPSLLLVSLVATATFTSLRAGDIPFGSTLVMAPFYLSAGIPAEGIGVLIGIEAIPRTVGSALNVTGHMAVATVVARRASATRKAA
jgi:Na+/H+-dicarboxylate symporter